MILYPPFYITHYQLKEKELDFPGQGSTKKNGNSFVEQKNSTHIISIPGDLRHDTEEELQIINELYRNELTLYKNFFQPVIKLKEKIRDKEKVNRKDDIPGTPYHWSAADFVLNYNNNKSFQHWEFCDCSIFGG